MVTIRSVSLEKLNNYVFDGVDGTPANASDPVTVGLDNGNIVTAVDDADTDTYPDGQITVRFSNAAGESIDSPKAFDASDPSMASTGKAVYVAGTTPDGQIQVWWVYSNSSGSWPDRRWQQPRHRSRQHTRLRRRLGDPARQWLQWHLALDLPFQQQCFQLRHQHRCLFRPEPERGGDGAQSIRRHLGSHRCIRKFRGLVRGL